jgi:hypothetical protein
MEGLKRLVSTSKHRKELVAGGLVEYLTSGASSSLRCAVGHTDALPEYRNLVDRLGSGASDFWSAYADTLASHAFRPMRLLKLPLSELPQVRLQCTYPFCAQISDSLRLSLLFEQSSSHQLYRSLLLPSISCNERRVRLLQASDCFLRKLGTRPINCQPCANFTRLGILQTKFQTALFHFPRTSSPYSTGYLWNSGIFVSVITFSDADSDVPRSVSFRYPGSEDYVLRDISFTVGPGQLCVRPCIQYIPGMKTP